MHHLYVLTHNCACRLLSSLDQGKAWVLPQLSSSLTTELQWWCQISMKERLPR